MRSNYWSCSPFADWLRGTAKPLAEDGKGWRVWQRAAKDSHPIRFWIAEEGLDHLQNMVYWPADRLYDIKSYINNRWVTRTHALTAHASDIKPGSWCDVGNRFLPCLFNELRDFVEVELAWWHTAWDQEARKKYRAPFWSWGWFRWRTWRSAQAGLDNLEWQRGLTMDETWGVAPGDPDYGKPTPQAERAQEILDLYIWWTEIRPQRPDVHDASGWTAYCEMRRGKGYDFLDMDDKTPQERKMCQDALRRSQEIEEAYENEDEAMMIRLIRARRSLWT